MSEHVKEQVNHPSHYNREGAMECIDEMLLLFTVEEVKAFCKLSAYKYRYRAGQKEDAMQDLKKSDWYIREYKKLSEKPSEDGSFRLEDYCIKPVTKPNTFNEPYCVEKVLLNKELQNEKV